MNTTIRFYITACVLVGALAGAADAEMRTWTSTSGATVAASYEGFENGLVVLKGEDGALMQIPMNMLAPADQEVARKLALAAGHISDFGTGAITPGSTNQLPTYADGKFKNQHTVYESPYYRATLSGSAVLVVQTREDGKDVGPPFTQNVGAYYGDLSKPAHQQYTPRPIARFNAPPAPAMLVENQASAAATSSRAWPPRSPAPGGRTHTVTLSGVLHDEVSFTRTFVFEPTVIRISATYGDPSKIEYPTAVGFAVHFSAALNTKAFESLEAIQAASEGWEISLKGPNMREDVFPFWPMIERGTYGVDETRFKGPWGTRTIRFDMPPSRAKGGGKVYTAFGPLYAGLTALDGFNLGRTHSLGNSDFRVEYTILFE